MALEFILRDMTSEQSLIYLSEQRYSFKEISRFIKKFKNLSLSVNAIGKRLRRLGRPSRRGRQVDEDTIRSAIQTILPDLPETVGYRTITRILHERGYPVRRDTVMKLMRIVDKEGTEMRRRRRIQRRIYHSFGPNHIWHVDGFSRKIMWLGVGSSNNDPAIVASNFVECIEQHKGCPLILQTDPGTENIVMGALQCVFRHHSKDPFSGPNSFRVTRSVFNQRIEAWWSMFRRRKSQWWLNFFRDMELSGIYHRGNTHETYCLRYSLMNLLQKECLELMEEWNSHYISHTRLAMCPNGRPEVLYSLEGSNCLQPVNDDDIALGHAVTYSGSISGSEQFDIIAERVFQYNGLAAATNWRVGMENYVKLLTSPYFDD